MLPIENTIERGKDSQRNPYITAESAEPPMQAELKNPRVAPRFSSGSASIRAEENMVFPAVLVNAPKNENRHTKTKLFDIYPATINTVCREKHIAIIQKRALELNLIIPRSITQMRDAAVQTDIR